MDESKRRIAIAVAAVVVIAAVIFGVTRLRKDDTKPAAVASVDTQATTAPVTDAPAITIQGFKFSPASINAKVGDTVTVTNRDQAKHTFTSGVRDAPDGTFALEVGGGFSDSVKLDKAATYTYYCKIHPGMKGTIVVTE